ncbi:hypothetical protein [Roseimaritima ulvae]|uniref:Uncharacterized protein n=1 Tax=Roseimaritima ulvae TaxID=980254 RepID=A0A5B9QW16_9BACT|nr:hypothetical protein [Roseimaritima ulvae]QEG43244.1 hypothetical protein UC8_52910 [Roseimaritima ulvae]
MKILNRRPVVTVSVCILPVALVLATTGCSEPEPIRVYSIDRQVPEELQSKSRMLGAIIPQQRANWFVKLKGPESAVDTVADQVRQFVATMEFEEELPVLSDLPEDWQQVSPGSGPFAPYAKISIETPEHQLDLTLTQLGRQADWDAGVLANVNRWRGQMGLPSLESKWAGAQPLDADAAEGPTTLWVDLVADENAAGGGMTPPMMTPPMMQPPAATGADSPANPHGSATPGQDGPPAVADSGLHYEAPEGWREGRKGGMRLATLDIGEGDTAVEVTFIRAGGDLRSNVGMWVGQVAGDAEMVDEVVEAGEDITVDGQPAKRLFMAGEGDDAQAIDIVVVESEAGLPLFIKMKGPEAEVRKQQEAMTRLIESIKLKAEE